MERYELTAKRLNECLNEFNMIPKELAEKSKIDKALISMYLNGKRCPSNVNAGKIASVFKNVSPVWLMGFDVDKLLTPEENADQDYELVKKFHKLNKAHQKDVISLIENLLRSESL